MSQSMLGCLLLRPTGDYLLTSLLWFLAQEDIALADLDPDRTIEEQFNEVFDESVFILAVGLFEHHHGLNIPDACVNSKETLRQFTAKIRSLTRLSPYEYDLHILEGQHAMCQAFEQADDTQFTGAEHRPRSQIH